MSKEDRSVNVMALLTGAVIGAIAGAATAHFLSKTLDEQPPEARKIAAGSAVKASMGVVAALRAIIALGR